MNRGAVKLAPSILAADFALLGEQVSEAEQAGADRIHVDVMDGHFVPNIAIGAPILVHWESNNNLHRTVQRIKSLGKRAGVAINPATSATVLEEILPNLDQVLVMTVNPGFGHQHFLTSTLPKIRRVALMIEQINPDCELGVDGGIDEATAPMVVAAGANVLITGTSVFGANKAVAAAMESSREAVTQEPQ
jgi:ribulose-phosphate 3-epimerase